MQFAIFVYINSRLNHFESNDFYGIEVYWMSTTTTNKRNKGNIFFCTMRPLPKLQTFHQKHIVCKTIHVTRQSAKIAAINKWYRITDRFQSNLCLPLIKTEIKLYFI